jgi:hypothetical protein
MSTPLFGAKQGGFSAGESIKGINEGGNNFCPPGKRAAHQSFNG